MAYNFKCSWIIPGQPACAQILLSNFAALRANQAFFVILAKHYNCQPEYWWRTHKIKRNFSQLGPYGICCRMAQVLQIPMMYTHWIISKHLSGNKSIVVNTILAAGLNRPQKKQPQISPSLLPLVLERGRLPNPPFFQCSQTRYSWTMAKRKIPLTAKIDYVTHRFLKISV